MNDTIVHDENRSGGTFYIDRDGSRVAEMTYVRRDATYVVINHTEVDPTLRGHGVARSLFDAAVAWARQTGTKLGATCSYAVAQFRRDPSLHDVQG